MSNFLKNVEILMNSKMHGNSLRSEILRIAKMYKIKEIKIIRTKRGYIVYLREK